MSAPQKTKPRRGKLGATLCSIIGVVIMLAVILTYLPLTLPQLMGYAVFHVETPSMSPAIPQGSVVYIEPTVAKELEVGEVAAFYSDTAIVIHRVAQNRVVQGELITRGDANPTDDPEPVPYSAVIGRVCLHIPVLGGLLAIYASSVGKIYALLLAASGLMFLLLAGRLRARRSEELRENIAAELGRQTEDAGQTAEAQPEPELAKDPEQPAPKRRKTGKIILIVALLVVFLGSGVAVLILTGRYRAGRSLYETAASEYVSVRPAATETPNTEPAKTPADETVAPTEAVIPAPIAVDFAALQAVNPDIIGWIYCEDTPINFPLLQGETNDSYLRTGFDGNYCYAGSIFLDAENRADFTDDNTIIYGHNLRDGSMFACLENWADTAYFDAHPVIWILTPEQNYRIELFAGYLTDAYDTVYRRSLPTAEERSAFVTQALSRSDVTAAVTPSSDGCYVLLSTCAYNFEEARYVLHGEISPAG